MFQQGALECNLDILEKFFTKRLESRAEALLLLIKLSENESEFDKLTFGFSAKVHGARLLLYLDLDSQEEVKAALAILGKQSKLAFVDDISASVLNSNSVENKRFFSLSKSALSREIRLQFRNGNKTRICLFHEERTLDVNKNKGSGAGQEPNW